MDKIYYINRTSGQKEQELVSSENGLNWLYNTGRGKLALDVMFKRKMATALVGRYMSSVWSRRRIKRFVLDCSIDMSEFILPERGTFATFNEFFYRKLAKNKRPIGNGVVSPADGRVLAFRKLAEVRSFFVKGTEFSIPEFLDSPQLSDKYKDGAMIIVRLAPVDYHRFHFPESGHISESNLIKGKYYSVSPIALKKSLEIFCQNKREYSVLTTKNVGDVLISEVGATMVGSIVQTYSAGDTVAKGDEKGYFAFGGSTVVLLFEKGKVKLADDLCKNTEAGIETFVKMGESIGVPIK